MPSRLCQSPEQPCPPAWAPAGLTPAASSVLDRAVGSFPELSRRARARGSVPCPPCPPRGAPPQVPAGSREHWFSQQVTERREQQHSLVPLTDSHSSLCWPCQGLAGVLPHLCGLPVFELRQVCSLGRAEPGNGPLLCPAREGRDAAPRAAGWVQQEVRLAKLGV